MQNKNGFLPLQIGQDGNIQAHKNFFDGATCVEVFEHLFDPLAAAREIYRVLKPNGVLVSTVPNFGYFPWRLQALIRARVPSEPENPKENFFNGVHIRYFNTSTFKRLLRDAGFTKIKIQSFDSSSIWDVFLAFSYLVYMTKLARRYLPSVLHLSFLQDILPCLFAYRIRATAIKHGNFRPPEKSVV
jgi:SAM-dependent methyltransferase